MLRRRKAKRGSNEEQVEAHGRGSAGRDSPSVAFADDAEPPLLPQFHQTFEESDGVVQNASVKVLSVKSLRQSARSGTTGNTSRPRGRGLH